ncbi:glycosyltransferase family 4 protein [Aquabacterium sp.]|uniref:glycosyltransferase family 4 protein n=1 Tax=Aquabacterium sp. TaxID=1872578 RepID=UPI003D6D7263
MNPLPPKDHVVIFNPELIEFGGEERVMLALARELHARGIKHSFACYWDRIDLVKHCNWPVRVHQINPPNNPVQKVMALRAFLSALRRQGSPVPVLFNIQSAYHAGLAGSGPYHVRIPDTYRLLGQGRDGQAEKPSSLKQHLSRMLSHWATRRGVLGAECFITNTKALQAEMLELYGRQAKVVYLGGLGHPRTDVPVRGHAVIELLTVSRLQASKRIDWILASLAEITQEPERYPAWRLHVAGTGPDEARLKALVAQLGLASSVVFHGFVSDEALQQLYENAHVFLMPGKQGYGLPAIEALYQKLALVSSEESGVVELWQDTPWVSVARQGQAGFTLAVKDMLLRVVQPDFFQAPLPYLPTEKAWADQMVEHCGWRHLMPS